MVPWCLNNNFKSPPHNYPKQQPHYKCIWPIDEWCSTRKIAKACGVRQYCKQNNYVEPGLSFPSDCNLLIESILPFVPKLNYKLIAASLPSLTNIQPLSSWTWPFQVPEPEAGKFST